MKQIEEKNKLLKTKKYKYNFSNNKKRIIQKYIDVLNI